MKKPHGKQMTRQEGKYKGRQPELFMRRRKSCPQKQKAQTKIEGQTKQVKEYIPFFPESAIKEG